MEQLAPPPKPNAEALLRNLRREGTPDRVYFMELFLDGEIQHSIAQRFGVGEGLDPSDPLHGLKFHIELQRFLGYDTVRGVVDGYSFPRDNITCTDDTTQGPTRRQSGRRWTSEHHGPIASMEDFEKYPWPETKNIDTRQLEWLEANLPDDMCVTANCHSVFENVTWLMGYETLCYKMYDEPEFVDAMFERVGGCLHKLCKVYMQFDRVAILFGGDDMGFKTGTMVPPQVLIEKSFPWHKRNAQLAHAHGKPYLLHACGNLEAVMPALLDDVQIDGRHSFEDVILPVTEAKRLYGDRIALLGGIDVDLLARADEGTIRERVRETLDVCHPGGGYCLGSGNSVTNYVPVDNYLAMMDEGRRYAG